MSSEFPLSEAQKMRVASRARRNLKRCANYRDLINAQTFGDAGWVKVAPLEQDEILLGVYLNHPDTIEAAIIVTDSGLYLHQDGKWVGIAYARIESVDDNLKAKEEKFSRDHLILDLYDGYRIVLPVRGGMERFRDVFLFERFLRGVIRNIQRNVGTP